MNQNLDSSMGSANQAQDTALSWFTKQEDWDFDEKNPSGIFFGFSNYPSLVSERQIPVERPAYVFFGDSTIFIDVPFSPMEAIDNLDEELGPWGIGSAFGSYTYHLTLTHDQIVNSPDSSLGLVRAVLDAAATREYELTGEISSHVAKNPGQTQSKNYESEFTSETPADSRFAEFTWRENVRKAVSGRTLTHEELAKCFVSIARSIITSDAPFGEHQALAPRVIWRFKSDALLWFAAPVGCLILSHLEKELNKDQVSELLGELDIRSNDFEWNPDSNGWLYSGELNVWELVSELSKAHGEYEIFLPWGEGAPEYFTEDFETMMSTIELDDEDLDDSEDFVALFNFMQVVMDGSLTLTPGVGSIQVVGACELMPKYASIERFNRFLDELESERGWLVMTDVCCSTCLKAELEADESYSSSKNLFTVWAQNDTWDTTGAINHQHDKKSGDPLELEEVASKHGLRVISHGLMSKVYDLIPVVGPGYSASVEDYDFRQMVLMLAEIWERKRNDPDLADFVDYAEIELPLSSLISRGLVKEKDSARDSIRSVFRRLIEDLEIGD